MADSRLQNALRQIEGLYPGMVHGVALERAIALMQAEAIADLADAVARQTLLLEREAARLGDIKVGP